MNHRSIGQAAVLVRRAAAILLSAVFMLAGHTAVAAIETVHAFASPHGDTLRNALVLAPDGKL